MYNIYSFIVLLVPVYAVFLAPEILHFAIIFFAYFLWLYKEVKPDAPAWLRGRGSDIAAAMLLGAATYSKPPNHALLVAPIVLWLLVAAQVRCDGLLVGAVCVAVTCALFGAERRSNTGRVQLPGRRSQDVLHSVSVRRLEGQRLGPQGHGDEHERLGRRQRARRTSRTASRTTSSISWSAATSALCRISFRASSRSRCGSFSRERRAAVARTDLPRRGRDRRSVCWSSFPYTLERRRRTDRQPLLHEHLSGAVLPDAADDLVARRRCSPGSAARCSPPRCSSTRSTRRRSPHLVAGARLRRAGCRSRSTMANDLPIMLDRRTARTLVVQRRAAVFSRRARLSRPR